MQDKCHIKRITNFLDRRGRLGVVEATQDIPFEIKRIYYIYDVPEGLERGEHAHARLQQLIIPISGSFEVTLDDGNSSEDYVLDDPAQGLYVCPMMWRSLRNFSDGAVGLVLASDHYAEEDYIFDYDEFVKMAQA